MISFNLGLLVNNQEMTKSTTDKKEKPFINPITVKYNEETTTVQSYQVVGESSHLQFLINLIWLDHWQI